MTRTIFKSKFADIDIPLIDLPAFFFGKVRQHAEFACTDSPRQLLIDGTEGSTESLTLGQVEEMTERLASGLYNKLGVRQGDVLAVVLPSSIYYPVVVLAALMVGATCTLANPAYTSGELAHQLEDSGSKFVIATRALLPVIAGASEGQHTEGSTPAISLEHHTLIVEGPLAQTGATGDNAAVRSIFDILSDSYYPRAHLTTFEALSATTALIPYSSGTTGLPKGVKLSHYNLVANLLQVGLVLGQMTSAKYPRTSMGILPMFHSFGMVAVALGMPTCGSSLVVMPKFEMAQFLSLVQKHRATDAMLVPPIINALVKLPMVRKYDLSSMSWIVCGAAPLSTSTIIALETLFDGISVMQGYGLTETSPGISINSPHIKNTDSSGPLLPNIEAIVIDDLGRALGTDEVGELCFRGPNVMTGYLNNDQATRETI
ncbi:acetyl-CoA synthetase-like protein, partial [Martensiomyces pterosporus]